MSRVCELLHENPKSTAKPQDDFSGRVDMRGWHIDHEEDAQGPDIDDPTSTNKSFVAERQSRFN